MNTFSFDPQYIATTSGALYSLSVVALIVLASLLRKVPWIYIVVVLPSTLLHELMHFVVGLVLNGQPQSLSVIPIRTSNGYTLGSVGFTNLRWYNGALIGLAPLLLIIPLSVLLSWRLEFLGPKLNELPWVYCFSCLLLGSLPSLQDVKIAIKYSWWLIVMVVLVLLWVMRIVLEHLLPGL